MAEKNESQDKINESSSEEDVEMESDESEDSSDDDASDSLIEELQQKVNCGDLGYLTSDNRSY